ncbi:MAG: DUF5723 family protein [Flavobacteriales bacterium]
MRSIGIILVFVLHFFTLHSQENMGIANSNFSPTNTIFLNPSSSADSKAFIDFNIIGASNYVLNDYAYFNDNLLAIYREGAAGNETEPRYDLGAAPFSAYVDVQIHGPSLSVSYGKFGGGLFMNLRSVASISGVPAHLANHATNGFDFEDQLGNEYTTINANIGSLSWLEYGVNFSYIISQSSLDMYTLGGSLKYLNGLAGAGINVQKWDYQVQNDSILNSFEFEGEYGLPNIPADQTGASGLLGNGSGVGLDLGFNYKKMKKSTQGYLPHAAGQCKLKDYQYKFGLSLLDIGSIGIKNGFYREFSIEDSVVWENYGGADPEEVVEIDELVNKELLRFSNDSESSSYRMALPTALSAQFDYNFGKGFYANSTLVHGFSRKRKLGIKKSSTFSITPRYERRQLEVALPLTIQNYQKLRLGAAIRIYSVIFGTDNLGGLMGRGRTYGADFYFSFKYTMFKPWYCKEKLKRAPKRKKAGVACPIW